MSDSTNPAILVLAQYYPPDMGGASTRVSNVVKGLHSKGCKITVVTAFPHYPHGNVPERYKKRAIVSERTENALIYRVWIPSLPHSTPLKRLISHFSFVFSSLFAVPFVKKPDIIWAANPNLFCFLPSLIYSFFKRAKIIRNVDDLWPEVFYELGYVKSKFIKNALDTLAWFSYKVPAAITPISEGYKNFITKKYGIAEQNISVIEVGVENVKPKKIISHRKGPFIIMYSGVLGSGYDFDTILRSAQILATHPNIKFVIRGIGELASKLENDVSKLRLKNVVLDTRFLSKKDLNDVLSTADVFILPTASANFGNLGLPTKLFEYQAHAKPIICISNGDPAAYIRATDSGLIVEPKNSESLANAILDLYADRVLGTRLGSNGQRYVSENLISDKIGERMLIAFKKNESVSE